MAVIIILSVSGFAAVLSMIEVPKLLREKSYKEFFVFSLLLALGVVLTILKALKVDIGNPSDLFAWIYSPLEGIMKPLLTKG